jgi:hypothetical protein
LIWALAAALHCLSLWPIRRAANEILSPEIIMMLSPKSS